MSEDNFNESALVAEAVDGSRLAYESLVAYHAPMIFNLCLKIVGNHEDASDCAQETFIKAYKGIRKFRKESKFSTWISRIAVNSCKNHISSSYMRHSRGDVSIENSSNEAHGSLDVLDGEKSLEESLISHEEAQVVQSAVRSLPIELRTLVVLLDFENRSYGEISEITGLPKGTVKSRIARARNFLRDALRGSI